MFKKIDKLFYCYQGIAYKIDTRGGKLVFYSKFNLLFKDNNPQLKLDTSPDMFNDLKPYLTLGQAISDLPFIQSGETATSYSLSTQNDFQELMRKNSPQILVDHVAPKNNQKLIDLMKQLPDGGTPLDLPEIMRPKSGFANTYSKLWWDKPSTTITRNLSTPSSSRCIHPKAPRPLTTREGARIQTFPDNYIFYGSRCDKNLQIGNAVPPFLSIALTKAIKDHLI